MTVTIFGFRLTLWMQICDCASRALLFLHPFDFSLASSTFPSESSLKLLSSLFSKSRDYIILIFFSPWVLIVEWCPGKAYKMSKCCYKIFVEHFSALSPRSSSHFLRAISNGLCTIWFVIQTLRSAKKCEEKYIVRCDICPEDTIIGDATD